MRTFLALALIATAGTAQADGLDFSGTVAMGVIGTPGNGISQIQPYTHFTATAAYTMETDFGLEMTFAVTVDATGAPRGASLAMVQN